MARPDITRGSDHDIHNELDGFAEAAQHMAAEFRRKKKAFELNNRSAKTTGSVDPRRIARYKTSDDIFRRKVYTPEGKSHGVCILLDTSGSMDGACYDAAIRQAVMISIFCKQLKIPFSVITFTSGRASLFNEAIKKHLITPENFKMHEILHSGMTIDQIESFFSLYSIMGSQEKAIDFLRKNSKVTGSDVFQTLDNFRNLFVKHCTPLFDAIACTLPLMHNMAIRHKVQNMNLLTITDGQSSSLSQCADIIVHPYTGARVKIPSTGNFNLNCHIALNTLLGMEKIKHHTLYITNDTSWENFVGADGTHTTSLGAVMEKLFGVKNARQKVKINKGVCEFMDNMAGFTSCFATSSKEIGIQENMNLFAKLIAQQFTSNFE